MADEIRGGSKRRCSQILLLAWRVSVGAPAVLCLRALLWQGGRGREARNCRVGQLESGRADCSISACGQQDLSTCVDSRLKCFEMNTPPSPRRLRGPMCASPEIKTAVAASDYHHHATCRIGRMAP